MQIGLLSYSIIATIIYSGCQTVPVIPVVYDIPTLEEVRPPRPVLEPVTISEGMEIPPTMLRNYNAVVTYSLDLEDYAWGGENPGGLEKYIKDIASLYSSQRKI